jgi:hypothetical protein
MPHVFSFKSHATIEKVMLGLRLQIYAIINARPRRFLLEVL